MTRRIRLADQDVRRLDQEDELRRSLKALHSIGQHAVELERAATIVVQAHAMGGYQTAVHRGLEYGDAAYRRQIEERAAARPSSPTPDHMRRVQGELDYEGEAEGQMVESTMHAEARRLAHEQLDELFEEDETKLPLLLWLMAGLSQEASGSERSKGAEAAGLLLRQYLGGPELGTLVQADESDDGQDPMAQLPIEMAR